MGKGKLNLTEKDFVAVYDDEGNKLDYEVPKHWGPEDLAAGVTTKKPKSTSSTGSSSTAPAAAAAAPSAAPAKSQPASS